MSHLRSHTPHTNRASFSSLCYCIFLYLLLLFYIVICIYLFSRFLPIAFYLYSECFDKTFVHLSVHCIQTCHLFHCQTLFATDKQLVCQAFFFTGIRLRHRTFWAPFYTVFLCIPLSFWLSMNTGDSLIKGNHFLCTSQKMPLF